MNAANTEATADRHPMKLGTYDPEPLNLRQREVIALESIAGTLKLLSDQFEWFAQLTRNP